MADPVEQSYEELKNIFKSSNESQNEHPKVWLKLVRDKLYSMFRAPMKDDYRIEAFKWVANLCISIGDFSWLSPDGPWCKRETEVFSCIAHLSMNEIHIILPLIQRHLTCGDNNELEDGRVLARSANSSEYEQFGDHLVIIESIIKSLVQSQDEDEANVGEGCLTNCIAGQELKSLLERLKGTLGEVCEYLEVVHRYWTKLIEQIDSEKFSAAEGALRIMSVWISEDSASFEPQSRRFLIDLIIKNLLLKDRPTHRDLMVLALHSACTQSDDAMAALKSTNGYKEALQNYLNYVQDQRNTNDGIAKRDEKIFKLRCGLVKDMLVDGKDDKTGRVVALLRYNSQVGPNEPS